VHTAEDLLLRQHILNIMCRHATQWDAQAMDPALEAAIARLQPMVEDGLVTIHTDGLQVTDSGRPFVRNICMALDARLAEKVPAEVIFSTTV
jgi:oxygen-independent coproporphyrinogen-3 oxidase